MLRLAALLLAASGCGNPNPVEPAGCLTDYDCKGSRICINHVCSFDPSTTDLGEIDLRSSAPEDGSMPGEKDLTVVVVPDAGVADMTVLTDQSAADIPDLTMNDLSQDDLSTIDLSPLIDLGSPPDIQPDLRPNLGCFEVYVPPPNTPPVASYSTDFKRAEQPLPTTLTGLQAYFPTASSASRIYTFEESSGSVIEKLSAGPPLAPTGTVRYRLFSPLATGKHAMSAQGVGDGLIASTAAAFNPSNTSFSIVTWVRLDLEAQVNNAHTVIAKYDQSINRGYTLSTSFGQFRVNLTDSQRQLQLSTSGTPYTDGAWHLVVFVWDSPNRTVYIHTEQESVSATSTLLTTQIGVPSAARILNGPDGASPLNGELAYLAFIPGVVVTAQQVRAFAVFGNRQPDSVLSFSHGSGKGIVGLDRSDPVFGDRVIKWSPNQFPSDARYGRPGYLTNTVDTNFLQFSEDQSASVWTTSPTPPTITAHANEAPDGSYTATKIEKVNPGVAAVSVGQSSSLTSFQAIAGSVWLRADQPHTAGLHLVVFGANAIDKTVSVNVTSAWQRFVVSSPLTTPGSLSIRFEIFPADPTDDQSIGSVYSWGAAANANLAGGEYYPTIGSADQSGNGLLKVNSPLPGGTEGYLEIAFVPTGLPNGERTLLDATNGGRDGLRLRYSGPFYSTLFYDDFGTLLQYNPWDVRKFYQAGLRTHLILTWDPTGHVEMFINGSAPTPADGVLLPTSLPAAFTLGLNAANSPSEVVIERFAVGSQLINRTQALSMAAAAGVKPVLRVGCMGDSITGFQDGFHARLNQRLGPGKAVVVSHGVSGDTTDLMLARFEDALFGRNYAEAIVLAGINDILFYNASAADVESNLLEMYRRAACAGMRVIAMTLLPSKGNAFNNWTTGKQATVEAVNDWIRSKPEGVDEVVDGYALFNNPSDRGAYLPGMSYDGLHPFPVASDLLGDLVFQQAYGGKPIP